MVASRERFISKRETPRGEKPICGKKQIFLQECPRGKRLSVAHRWKIVELLRAGKSISTISRQVGCTRTTVYATKKLFQRTGGVEQVAFSPGRPRTSITPRILRVVRKLCDRPVGQRLSTNRALRSAVIRTAGVAVPVRSLRRAKRELSLLSRVRARKPIGALKLTTRDLRLQYAHKHAGSTPTFWDNVVFMDQSQASCDTGRYEIVPRGEAPSYRPSVNRNDEKVHFMCWVSTKWKSPMEFLPLVKPEVARPRGRPKKGAANSVKVQKQYWTGDLLKKLVLPYLPQLKRASLVVLDNAGPHKPLKDFLHKHGVKLAQHPPHSPDLNPIEGVWETLKTQAWDDAPTNNHELQRALSRAWDRFAPRSFARFSRSMKKRLVEVIRVGGLPTRY
jgi:transposase